jgi:hypothetical protein
LPSTSFWQSSDIVVINDREKGLEAAHPAILPHHITYYCAKHLEKKPKTQFSCSLEEYFWIATTPT